MFQVVTGEIYEVDDKMLENLDVLEEHPAFYIREKRSFRLVANNDSSEVVAWVYLLKTFRESLLDLTYQTDYRSAGPHGLIYCERSERDKTYDACTDVQGIPRVQ